MSTQSLSPTALPKLTRVQYLFLFLIGAGLVLALTVIFLVSFGTNPAEQIEPRIGQPSPLTIVAPERLTYPSQIDTQAAQDRAAALVTDVYSPPDENRAREQLRSAQRVLAYVDTVRQDPYSRGGDKIELVRAVPSITLPADTISRTLALEDDTYHRVVSETLYVLELAMRDELLRMLVTHAGKVLTHSQILRQIWGVAYVEQQNVLRVNISHLRQKIEKDASRPRYIITEPGVGYRLKGE